MFNRRFFTTVALFLLFSLLIAIDASAVDAKPKYYYSIRFGYFGSGTLTVNDFDIDTKSGLAYGFAIDIPTRSSLLYGFTFDAFELKFSSEKSHAYSVAFSLKYDVVSGEGKFAFRPGIAGGIAITPDIGDYIEKSYNFTFRAATDLIYFIDPKVSLVGEIGAIWDIYGRAGDDDLSGGPFLFIRGGVGF